ISAELCTSGMVFGTGAFMAGFLSGCMSKRLYTIPTILLSQFIPDAGEQSLGIQAAIRQQLRMLTLLDEGIRQAEMQQWHGNAQLLQAFGHRTARTALHGVLLHRHQQLML